MENTREHDTVLRGERENTTSDFAAQPDFWARYWNSDPRSRKGLQRRERATQILETDERPRRVIGAEGDLAHALNACVSTIRDDFRALRADRRLIFYWTTATGDIRETTACDRENPCWRDDRERVWSRQSIERRITRTNDGTLDTYGENP